MADISIEPPNSRLFILCSKNLNESDLQQAFDRYGNVEDIWIVKDKNTNESKGVVYIKYSKSSEAALAMEEMNGKVLANAPKPIKVMIAHSREQGSKKDDDPERLLRLFIVVPKSMTEEELREHFKQFGEVEYVSIVKNRDTGESKGVGYVKYYRAYHAAKAFEECSKSFKAVFARPREPKVPSGGQYDPPMERMSGGGGWIGYGDNVMPMGGRGGSGGHGDARLIAAVHSSLRQEQVYKLFDIAPGLVDIRPQANAQRNYYNQVQKVLVEYNCPQAASYAAEKLHGFEYPPGHRISIRSASGDLPPPSRGALLPNAPTSRMDMNGSGMTTISTSELATLNAALAKAEAIIKNRGLAPSGLKSADDETFDPTYCSVRLPPPQQLVPPPDGPTHRLFIVCQPGLPSMYALRDIFGRFGNLVEVYTLHGKNCGYVTYATQDSAEEAIKKLHLQEVCGMRMKVMVAEPPRGGPDRSDRKRLRIDHESAEA